MPINLRACNMIFYENKKFTQLHLFILAIVVALTTYQLTNFWKNKQSSDQLAGNFPICKLDIKRFDDLKYIRPIMFANEECESDDLMGLKQRISKIISRHKLYQDVALASVYPKNYNNNDWMSLNDEEKY